MVKLKRRQVLLGTLMAGTTATLLHEWARQRKLRRSEDALSDLVIQSPEYLSRSLEDALTSDTQALERLEKIQSSYRLTPPTVPYSREMSKRLIQCCRLGTEQYLYGKFDPAYQGAITTLPSFSNALQGFTQVATIKGPDYVEVSETVQIPQDVSQRLLDPLRKRLNLAEDEIRAIAGRRLNLRRQIPVYWGFVLSSPQANIIVYRGTQLSKEWLQNFQARLIPAAPESQFRYPGKAHEGFVQVYRDLAQPTLQALATLDPTVPCYFTGHSLGAAVALLAGMDAALQFGDRRQQLHIYTYGCPRVGDPTFAAASTTLTPNNYRIINLADAFTLVPPINIGEYVHTGQEWSFLFQRNDISGNHFVSTYRQAIEQELEMNQPRTSPSSCV